jgi:hypothetical protein
MERTSAQSATARVVISAQLPNPERLPELLNIHLKTTGSVVIGRVGLGPALINTEKQLVPAPSTGLPYRVHGDTYSLMILSTQNTKLIPSGDWIYLDLMIGDTSSEPVSLRVVKRVQTFAPTSADMILWGEEYDTPVIIWPALNEGE